MNSTYFERVLIELFSCESLANHWISRNLWALEHIIGDIFSALQCQNVFRKNYRISNVKFIGSNKTIEMFHPRFAQSPGHICTC